MFWSALIPSCHLKKKIKKKLIVLPSKLGSVEVHQTRPCWESEVKTKHRITTRRVCTVHFMPQLKLMISTPKHPYLKAMAEHIAEVVGVTILAFWFLSVSDPLNSVVFMLYFAGNEPNRYALFSLLVSGRLAVFEPRLKLFCNAAPPHPVLPVSFCWSMIRSSSNARTNSCSVIAIAPMVCFIGKHRVYLRPAPDAKGFLRCAEHLSVSLSSAGVDSSKYLARVSTWHIRQVRQSAFYACQNVIVLVLVHSPISFLAENQLLHLIKSMPSTKRQQV